MRIVKELMPDRLRLVIIEKVSTLVITAFGLVAALAWNDAIQSFFKWIFGEHSSLPAKFFYAMTVTALIVVATLRLARMQEVVQKRLKAAQENEKAKEMESSV